MELQSARTCVENPGRFMFAHLNHQRPFGIVRYLASNVFDARAPISSQPIESKAVCLFVDLVNQSISKHRPLRWIHLAFKHRILHPLSEVLACTSDTTQAPPPGGIAGRDIVRD